MAGALHHRDGRGGTDNAAQREHCQGNGTAVSAHVVVTESLPGHALGIARTHLAVLIEGDSVLPVGCGAGADTEGTVRAERRLWWCSVALILPQRQH